jgi:transcriptional regulator with XRE-family HTH domain
MGTAARIRDLRARTGKTPVEMAGLLGVNIHWYDDLEQHDDELASTLTLGQAVRLAALLGATLHDLLAVSEERDEVISLQQLPERIASCLAREGISIEQFEDRIGWKLTPFLEHPVERGFELPLMFFQALAAGLGIRWLSLLPHTNAV